MEAARSSLILDPTTQGLALSQSPTGNTILGPVLTNPITGSVTGSDLAELLGQGRQVGIFHLGALRDARSGEATGSTLPPGVQQFMALRTQAAAPALDGGSISNAFAQNRVLGLSTTDAHSAALAQHGVALFQGNGAGVFNKVPSSGRPGH